MKVLRLSRRAVIMAAVAVAAAFLMTGCATKVTGGGFLPSANPTDKNGKADFGFVYNATDAVNNGGLAKFNGTYHDGDVRFRFDAAFSIPASGPDACSAPAIVHYVSQNPALPGDGLLFFTACDGGEPGASNGDAVIITVFSGPYTGYTNVGTISGGNIQAH